MFRSFLGHLLQNILIIDTVLLVTFMIWYRIYNGRITDKARRYGVRPFGKSIVPWQDERLPKRLSDEIRRHNRRSFIAIVTILGVFVGVGRLMVAFGF
jgi:hypothetical protein